MLLSLFAESSYALEFRLDSYDVTRSDSDPGLAINSFRPIVPLHGDVTFDLAIGESRIIDLFSIGTRERVVDGDDFARQPISVMFQFSEPQSSFSGVASGESFGVGQRGRIAWSDPVEMEFGAHDQGLLTMGLSSVTFGTPGVAVISADVTYARAVPEPTAILLIVTGLPGIGCCRGRAKTSFAS